WCQSARRPAFEAEFGWTLAGEVNSSTHRHVAQLNTTPLPVHHDACDLHLVLQERLQVLDVLLGAQFGEPEQGGCGNDGRRSRVARDLEHRWCALLDPVLGRYVDPTAQDD